MNPKQDTTAAVVRRCAVIMPVVLLSAAWTASVAGVGGQPSAVERRPAPLQATPPAQHVTVPGAEVAPPASVARVGAPAPSRRSPAVVPASGVHIPAAALAAYQRAAVVIGAADAYCHLKWPLVAAIGRVESNHGRAGGSVLDDDGVAKPAIVGVRLDGTKGTARISDTDAGRYDGDKSFDRAIGPLQFIPTTWSVVGVDADGDGARNPQDVDDAALATAVYLCSGDVDLAVASDVRRALLRYNHSDAYVDTVLTVMEAYAAGDLPAPVALGYTVPGGAGEAKGGGPASGERQAAVGDREKSEAAPPPVRKPEQAPEPSPAPSEPQAPGAPKPSAPDAPAKPAVEMLTRAQAALTCSISGLSRLLRPAAFQGCIEKLTATEPPAG
ncbi:lytic transglycosylase domain-containing protein [Nocardioides sp. SYSU DS0651]|uniref:lytic transglycosylase domain-containing protein n=1 Tax=Nocardioides sp. SYSU DS0651 TaxID=3415955 RepID=UPI003F4C6609